MNKKLLVLFSYCEYNLSPNTFVVVIKEIALEETPNKEEKSKLMNQ